MPAKTTYLILCTILLSGCSSTLYVAEKKQADDLDLPRYRPPAQVVNQDTNANANASNSATPQAAFLVKPLPSVTTDPPRVPAALVDEYEKALLQVAKLHYDKVVDDFVNMSTLFAQAGDALRSTEALFWHAYCLEKMGQKDNAIIVYDRIIKSHPQSKVGQQASMRKQGLSAK
jgi:TolA-binding protein